MFRGQHAVSVDQFASDQELRVVAAVGTAYPIHCTAHGKALLARLDDAALELLGARLERRTASTITARKDLLAQLAEVRTRGWALDLEEHAVGICGIGVHIETGQSEQYARCRRAAAARRAARRCLAALFQCKAEIESLLAG